MSFDPFMSVGCFRLDFPEFGDKAQWPDRVIEIALEEGDTETSGSRWGAFKDEYKNRKRRGLYLYAAHWLASHYPSGASNPANKKAGASGQVQSKTVADESVTYAVAAPKNIGEAAESWLLTTRYGQQFARLKKRALMGGMVV